ncbi:MAG: 6-phospho-3-hexuloisomerase [Archaeoglobaceae archaeon]|nr:6-phospho-3-hexuloisomerase [Archaeoglobaceae archaeon]MCX8152021.1 6-phospho-3-hexuloisomerase [Archaeoglobaceae archaeon]MDW8013410.1 6-phospho-3-hexuloisomerase [Archaeoglobaceae archaeon]
MSTLLKFMEKVAEHLEKFKRELDLESVEKAINLINSAERIFVIGSGRSGLIAKAFAMRLMHLGYKTYVVGETITPKIKEKDLLVAVSGSGETSYTVDYARKVKEFGVKVLSFTGKKESTLSSLSDVVVELRWKEKKDKIFPLGTLFEITAMVFLDALVSEIMVRKSIDEKEMEDRHALE